ncbi:DUF1642 domain-containing protein [Enterococcus faecalis]|uniref:DUF1642 domain-containing protein n=1 Tax=Enterococcus faecalis TaxID=1351 RepID=UPI0029592DA5|nr:DUF1642 domain-containing protein [Enterococcus faecalis]MDV7856354.1 DUF1642 domain-containing protein [Enterococcus faecalis]
MNNQKLIKKWESKEGVPSYEISAFPVNPSLNEMYIAGYGVARKEILDDLKQLDEPKKVVVPKFVADFIEDGNHYDKIAFLVHQKYLGINSIMRECPVKKWLMSVDYETVLSLVNGYEVEKEQLYYVKLTEIGYMRFGKKYFYSTDKEDAKRYTEKQIKAIDERYWPFAVKVDGE